MAEVMRALGDAFSRAAKSYQPRVISHEGGRVLSVADGVLRIDGLPEAASEELLQIGQSSTALVLGLRENELEAVVLHGADRIEVGAAVRSLGRSVTVPVGDALVGRAVDPLGRPLDGSPLTGTWSPMSVERPAPQIFERTAVHSPLYTGVLAVDSMFPIGRGQRELVLGDEGTGKTAFVVDVLLRQRSTDVLGVYVAVGRRRSETWQVVETLRRGGGRWVVVSAPDDTSPGLRFLAPFSGTAIAEYFVQRGEHALVVYDDLSSHAIAWRELSLLLRRPPGREAYPGDIFYLHARLLERAAQLSSEAGGGSLTAFPVAVLEAGRLTAYIPTNLISITDGQIVFSHTLFAAGQKPAIDGGLSVSRVGSKAQPSAFRDLAGRLRLDYAAFLELETFSRLGTRLEAETQRRIEVGRRIRALLKAPRLQPLDVFAEVVRLLLASSHDDLLAIPVKDVPRIADELTDHVRRELPHVAARVERDATLPEADRKLLLDAMAKVIRQRFPGARASDELDVEVVFDV
jgi:F-type H+-transporting ATPase subunit alpha